MLRECNRLLKMRDELIEKYGREGYAQRTAPYQRFVASQFAVYGCPRIAADNVVAVLEAPLAVDPEVQRIVKCAALDVAVPNITTLSKLP